MGKAHQRSTAVQQPAVSIPTRKLVFYYITRKLPSLLHLAHLQSAVTVMSIDHFILPYKYQQSLNELFNNALPTSDIFSSSRYRMVKVLRFLTWTVCGTDQPPSPSFPWPSADHITPQAPGHFTTHYTPPAPLSPPKMDETPKRTVLCEKHMAEQNPRGATWCLIGITLSMTKHESSSRCEGYIHRKVTIMSQQVYVQWPLWFKNRTSPLYRPVDNNISFSLHYPPVSPNIWIETSPTVSAFLSQPAVTTETLGLLSTISILFL